MSGSPSQVDAVDDVVLAEPALTSATPGGGVGAVFIAIDKGEKYDQCTGFLVGDSTVVTASHCFDGPLGSAWSGTARVKIHYAHAGGVATTCMTDFLGGYRSDCTQWSSLQVHRLISRSADGEHDPNYDFAAIFAPRGSAFEGVTAADGVWALATNTVRQSDAYVLYGRGCSSETCPRDELRVMRRKRGTMFSLYAGGEYFIDYPQQSRTCNGDSGGPIFNPIVPIVYGVHHGAEMASDEQKCGDDGGAQVGNLFSDVEIIFLNYWRALEGLPPCQASQGAGTYWTCS